MRGALAFGGVIWGVPLICVRLGVKAHEGSFGKAASDVHCAQLNSSRLVHGLFLVLRIHVGRWSHYSWYCRILISSWPGSFSHTTSPLVSVIPTQSRQPRPISLHPSSCSGIRHSASPCRCMPPPHTLPVHERPPGTAAGTLPGSLVVTSLHAVEDYPVLRFALESHLYLLWRVVPVV